MSEIDLYFWSRVQSDDREAYEILFHKYYATLCILSKRYTHDINSARDVVQLLFIHLWEKRKKIEIKSSLKAYLYQAIRYNSIRYIENSRKTIILLDEIPETYEDTVYRDHIVYAELQRLILDTIDSLPEQCQRVFKMSRFGQLKNEEIARQLSLSLKTVEAHISKALRILHEYLSRF
jgi:RNA polymerase sigma-70 factor (ECF subfamily)